MGEERHPTMKEAIPAPARASLDEWAATASDPDLNENRALALLKHAELPGDVLEAIHKNAHAMKSRKVRNALVAHPRTPRHISVPMIRHLFTFDLMSLSLAPLAHADIKMAADEALISRMETVSSGERLSLARRASGRVAGELLNDAEVRIVRAALDNGRLTEAFVVKAVLRAGVPAHTVLAVCHHPKWSCRREVRTALLRSEETPMAQAVEFARGVPAGLLREILHESRLPANVKAYLLAQTEK